MAVLSNPRGALNALDSFGTTSSPSVTPRSAGRRPTGAFPVPTARLICEAAHRGLKTCDGEHRNARYIYRFEDCPCSCTDTGETYVDPTDWAECERIRVTDLLTDTDYVIE